MIFKEEIIEDIDWRYKELSILRTLPYRYGLTEDNKEFLIKYSVAIIYSLWEGFVRSSFEIYVRKLNSMMLNVSDIHPNLLTHAVSMNDNLSLRNGRVTFETQKKFIDKLIEFQTNHLVLSIRLPLSSNVNFDVIQKLLERFNLEALSEDKFKRRLKKLLVFRNAVAHGDNSIPVKKENIEDFCDLINDLMPEIFNRIDDGFNNQKFKK